MNAAVVTMLLRKYDVMRNFSVDVSDADALGSCACV